MSQRTPLASNAGTTDSSGAVAARALRTTASSAALSWMSASRSTTGTSESWIAVEIGTAGGAGGIWLAQATSPTSGQSRSSRVMTGVIVIGRAIEAPGIRTRYTHESGRMPWPINALQGLM